MHKILAIIDAGAKQIVGGGKVFNDQEGFF